MTDYRSFWLIWLGCAGVKKGTTLYKIQQSWGIKTNYLYHKESKLGKPLFEAMIEAGYLVKGKRLKANFSWIPAYIIEKNKIEKKGWSGGVVILENWPSVQKFIEANCEILFSEENLKLLYNNSLSHVTKTGNSIFNDIFILSLITSINDFSKKYRAGIVERIMHTFISVFPDRNLLDYYSKLKSEIKFPVLIRDEREMNRSLCPFLE